MTESRATDTFKPGDLLNNTYRIEAVLGRGGTSEVYRARSEISGRVVALKVLRSEFSGNEDFLLLMTREEAMRDIRHDAVVRYSENHRTPDGHVYLIMDFVDGPGLDEKLRTGGMSADDLLVVATRVCEGLHAAHSRNITHRDLSPDNIILRGGKPAEAVIIDFGIAKDDNPGAETIVGNEFAGKYAYAAPEQLNGRTDARSDIYALGALLLATFRGAPPDIGRNPMEVIRNKALPLNTEGVPEPLKGLIDRMTAPDPAHRLQTAMEVLQTIDPDYGTTTLPPRRATTLPPPKPAAARDAAVPPPAAKAEAPKKRGGLVIGLVAALLLAVGIGGQVAGVWSSLLTPALPVAEPYTLIAERPAEGSPKVIGHAPDQATADRIAALLGGADSMITLDLAQGEIAPTWGADILTLLGQIKDLPEWRLAASGNSVKVTGLADDRSTRDTLMTALNGAGMPQGLQGSAEIALGPRILTAQAVEFVLREEADCGPLALRDPPATGYGTTAEVVVTGRLAAPETRVSLYDNLRAIAGDRKITVDAEVLNPTLCLIEANLPDTASGGFGVTFGFGDRPDENPGGRYFVGENPVIDIVIPADVTDGYLWVSVLDVSGNVFHLLPNLNRPDNAVADLRAGATGPLAVRVAFGLAEAQGTSSLAFLVDESTLGKSKVLVLHSATPIFADLRPTTESAAGFAEALAARQAEGALTGLTADSRILTTDAK